MKSLARIPLLLCAAIVHSVAADDVRDTRNLLCSVHETLVCLPVDGCFHMTPEELNVPRFIRVDTKTRTLSTTPASGENRVSVADVVQRADGALAI